MDTLDEAFEDNEAPSAAVGVDGSEVSLVVLLAPVDEAVPTHMPTRTAAGNLSLKKLTQREKADYYKIFASGHLLVTVREAFAVAPGIASARIAAMRNDGLDADGKPRVCCLLAARFERTAFEQVQWVAADAPTIVNDIATELAANQRGRSKELTPVDLTQEPALEQLVQAVDLTELIPEEPDPASSPLAAHAEQLPPRNATMTGGAPPGPTHYPAPAAVPIARPAPAERSRPRKTSSTTVLGHPALPR
jgi:hypothetical protein